MEWTKRRARTYKKNTNVGDFKVYQREVNAYWLTRIERFHYRMISQVAARVEEVIVYKKINWSKTQVVIECFT